jgi:nitroimidazol reductase NimA-like FMN-containing flavoprotein (pyridoxamine 5'-phosphate oxidase superfamily)
MMAPYREMSREECLALLQRQRVGRLAYSFKDRVDVQPIAYVWDVDTLFLRTGPGVKLETLRRNPWVALEVDEVRGLFEWESVVVKGTVYFLRAAGTEFDQATFQRGLRALRRIEPRFGTAEDPFGDRTMMFRIHVDAMTGRAAG